MPNDSILPQPDYFTEALFEALPGSCILLQNNAPLYTVLAATPAYLAQMGCRKEALLGKSIFEIAPSCTDSHSDTGVHDLTHSLAQVLRFRKPHALPVQRYDIAGADEGFTKHYRRVSNRPVLSPDGKVAFIIHTAEDISPEVSAMEQDEKIKGLKQAYGLFMQAPFAIYMLTGPHFRIDLANPPALAHWGKSSDVLGQRYFDVVPDLREQGFSTLLHDVLQTGATRHAYEVPLPRGQAGPEETGYFNYVCQPFRQPGAMLPESVLVIAIDVTRQAIACRKIEEVVAHRTRELSDINRALQEANQELKRSNANLEEFAYAASHDLQEPVRKIRYFTSHLKKQLENKLYDGKAHSFERIETATQRMGSLIDDLMQYAHVSQLPHEMAPVDLNLVVQQVLEDLELHIQQKGAVVQVHPLPVVKGYRCQLQQLFQNLVGNALKYSKPQVPPHISVSAVQQECDGRHFQAISVRDNGIGFPQEYEAKIFQMFARLHGKAEFSGSGVGLAIVKKMVENHHGIIQVRSVPGAGSTFTVWLPA
ncbi:PAS domain-containing protein [Flaviaesturariibacter flavus]|uniref:histidine kinase n=1 Tax=Flaviaesturariibacter flavus TaxID=2502780 RepID=A0A4R1B2V0_9BACT|nr:ATP-binding protein [Flaviaesturariibacter flavus]TCJ12161.1 PAS domain-containing protein [Flaviaesturariibacter flavus]